jgi:hypothetical protein
MGIGVDASGGPVVDPTENVLALVDVEKEHQHELRVADNRFLDANLIAQEKLQNFAREAESRMQDFAREAESKLQTALRQAETNRIDQLAQTRQEFQNTIRDMLAESVRTTSTLVSTQLVQIQATFDARVSKLEAFQFTLAGRSSVADPAIENAMKKMSESISALSASTAEMLAKTAAANAEAIAKLSFNVNKINLEETSNKGTQAGQSQVFQWAAGAIFIAAAILTPLITWISIRGH